ncbi:ABC transporter ATP-binding protein [Actinomadura madurae]|uniref:ABC transporter ATP-binding protein n=1 Tax=Actinomadura madurae TaxID=1993 RepID=UPI0020D1FDDD|nr:ABC transporter ATP-binding protein [Actinomadura madurae]MCP9952633.1 ABC transporter ATP-binding protein [Actinomadura madurae]
MKSQESGGGRIELVDLCKRFAPRGPLVVDHVGIDVAPGEFVTLLGPSGSGKTTTLNMIAGFTEATSGEIRLHGRDISGLPPHRRGFGMVFQNYALFPHMTVEQNVAFPLRERGVGKRETRRRVGDALDLVDLGGLAGRRPNELSGGQQQRVALARAVVYSPSVLLLDEPLSALDRRLRQTLQHEIKRIHDELKPTFVFVTHDQEEAMVLSDRIAVFNRGRIERLDGPAELYNRPGTRFVATFLGESNIFAGRLTGDVYVWGDRKWGFAAEGPGAGPDDRLLVVRPERVGLATEASAVPSGANRTEATVIEVTFHGTYQRVRLEFRDGTEGSAVLSQGAGGTAGLPDPGASVVAHWSPDDQVLVTDGPAASQIDQEMRTDT